MPTCKRAGCGQCHPLASEVDPVSLALETIPLLLRFEASIWLSAFMERRWEQSYHDLYET